VSTLKEILGTKVKSLASDPSNPVDGELWYNTTSKTFKGAEIVTSGSWATGGNLATARKNLAGAGTQTAGLAFGGDPSPTGATEEYNGSSWTAGGNLSTARYDLGGAGTQTAGLGFGGFSTTLLSATEEYDGSAWTEGGNLGTARYEIGGLGTQTAGLAFGGRTPGFFSTEGNTGTEEYDGTSWTAGGNLPDARREVAGAGTQTAGLAFGGFNGPTAFGGGGLGELNKTSEYNGTSWTAGGNLATERTDLSGAGTQTAGLAFGGDTSANSGPTASASTEEYDGTSWAAGGNLATARIGLGGAGTQTAGLGFGGTASYTPQTATEEYTGPGAIVLNTLTTS
jgi:hypothetical protein